MASIMFNRFTTAMKLVLITVFLNGCSVIYWFESANDLDEIAIVTSPDANKKLPIALDVVWVDSQQQLTTLSALTGPQWFVQKQQYVHMYGASMRVTSVEPVPGSERIFLELPDDSEDFLQVILFVDYINIAGHTPALLGHFNSLLITLHQDTYQLQEFNP
jgi:hypothetical protein